MLKPSVSRPSNEPFFKKQFILIPETQAMDSLITVMNRLQDVISSVGGPKMLDLPQIVVVGSQSSGKSSVLESLVGKSFLPRGTGIVTRVPLVLQIINVNKYETEGVNETKQSADDWATFLHKPEVVFYDFDKVRNEIEWMTGILAGDKKNITDKPITLNVYSRHLSNLSFVDLPGLTKVPIGDQPQDIEVKIRDLVLSYIQNPNSIILAVVTANTDPATSESLHVAKSVDPNGDRTIAVVTKIDIMDAGTDAVELLTGKVIPVKLGIVGLVNRSQKDINENKSILDSMNAEKEFFKTFYPNIADNHGTFVLSKKLQDLLVKKIQDTCPTLKKQLYEMNALYSVEMKKFKDFTDNYDRCLLELINKVTNSYINSLDGEANDLSMTGLKGGAKIANNFKMVFNKNIDDIDPLQDLSKNEIVDLISNASGISMGVFMPAQAFDYLVKNQMKLMEPPSLSCVNYVHEELFSNFCNLDRNILNEIKKYPKLKKSMSDILETMLDKYKQNTIKAVSKSIRYQEAFINTGHPDFIKELINSEEYSRIFEEIIKSEKQGLLESDSNMDGSESPPYETLEKPLYEIVNLRQTIEKITTSIFSGFTDTDNIILERRADMLILFLKCYIKVIKKIIQDLVPKTIMYELVNNVKANFQKDLISKIYKSKNINMTELLTESNETVAERTKMIERFKATEKALKLIREIEQLCVSSD